MAQKPVINWHSFIGVTDAYPGIARYMDTLDHQWRPPRPDPADLAPAEQAIEWLARVALGLEAPELPDEAAADAARAAAEFLGLVRATEATVWTTISALQSAYVPVDALLRRVDDSELNRLDDQDPMGGRGPAGDQNQDASLGMDPSQNADGPDRGANPNADPTEAHRALSDAEGPGQLGVAEAVAMAQHHEGPLRLAQDHEPPLHVAATQDPRDLGRRGVGKLLGHVVIGQRIWPDALPPQVVQAAVAGDGQQPGPRRGLSPKGRQPRQRPAEGILGEVLGHRRISHHGSTQTVHIVGQGLDEPARRAHRVALGEPDLELGVCLGQDLSTVAASSDERGPILSQA